MKKFILAILCLVAVQSYGQDIIALSDHARVWSADSDPLQEHLIADETYFVQGSKNNKVICSNDTINARILRAFENKLLRYFVTYKKDRTGRYRQVTYYLPSEVKEEDVLRILKR